MCRVPRLSAIALILCLSAWALADDPIVIEQHPVTATTQYYDAASPPAQMPPPTPEEAGVTVSEFSCTAFVTGTVLSQSPDGKLTRASVRVDSVRLVLNLKITEWILNTAPPKILAHENGHQKISNQAYATGSAMARLIAGDLLGKTFTATGKTDQAASSAALTIAANQAASQYMGRVRDPSQIVQVLYDRITAHGTNSVDEEDAVAIANREAGRLAKRDEGAATQPDGIK